MFCHTVLGCPRRDFFFFSAVGDIRFCGRESYCRAVKVLAYSHVVIAIADCIRQEWGFNIHLRHICRTKAGSYSYWLYMESGYCTIQNKDKAHTSNCWADAYISTCIVIRIIEVKPKAQKIVYLQSTLAVQLYVENYRTSQSERPAAVYKHIFKLSTASDRVNRIRTLYGIFILEINLRLKPVERRVFRSTYISRLTILRRAIGWFGVKNRTNHFFFFFFFLPQEPWRAKVPYIFSEPENTHTPYKRDIGRQEVKNLPNLGFGDRWADFDWDAHSSEDQPRPIKGSASLDPDHCTPTEYSVLAQCSQTIQCETHQQSFKDMLTNPFNVNIAWDQLRGLLRVTIGKLIHYYPPRGLGQCISWAIPFRWMELDGDCMESHAVNSEWGDSCSWIRIIMRFKVWCRVPA